MNSARTLADRFRTQRTDRIRVDGVEVMSMVELRVHSDEAAEFVIEQVRDDVEQAMNIRSRHGDLRSFTTQPVITDDFDADEGLGFEQVTLLAADQRRVELTAGDDADRTIQIWNSWLVGQAHHSWTGNSGIITEELEAPAGASTRVRLWCSDGLGDPSFDDLVAIVTIGPRVAAATSLMVGSTARQSSEEE